MSTSAFDSYAADYDRHFTNSPIGILLRKRVFKFLLPLLGKEKKVLEVNCGTGEDALLLAGRVDSVLATDISEGMIRVANLKKEKADQPNLSFAVCDMTAIHNIAKEPFDILFSDFGGLNCLNPEQLELFADKCSQVLSSKGTLALVIMGRKCLWEDLWFYLQKDRRLKRRRSREGIATQMEGTEFKTYYYSPREIRSVFSGNFKVKQIRPVGLFVPPSYLNPIFDNKPRILRFLDFLESAFGALSFTSNYADHYIIILEKNQNSKSLNVLTLLASHAWFFSLFTL